MKYFFLFSISVWVLLGCRSKSVPGNEDSTSVLSPKPFDSSIVHGQILSSVTCKDDTNFNYVLFLPSKYSLHGKYPVLFLFDPHANGIIPVKKYKSIADSLSLILIASNNSQNGQDPGVSQQIFEKLFSDAAARFAINQSEIYTCGLSGGARVAVLLAMQNAFVTGAIGCGAGFPSENLPNRAFAYVGIAGTQDFNYPEMLQLDSLLNQTYFPHVMLYFNGKHEWPPADVLYKSLQYILLQKQVITQNIFAQDSLKLLQLMHASQWLDAYQLASNMLHVYTNKSTWMTLRMNDIANNPYYNSDSRDFKSLVQEEKIREALFANSFTSRELSWWQNEITNLRVLANTRAVTGESAKRLINYISMLGYIYTDNALKSGMPDAAAHYLQIYQFDDSQNPDVYYLSAVLAMSHGQTSRALSLLQQSAALGLTDIQRLLQESAFASLLQQPQYQQVVQTVEQNIQK